MEFATLLTVRYDLDLLAVTLLESLVVPSSWIKQK